MTQPSATQGVKELLPCPFCGGDEPVIEKVGAFSRLFAVFCNACEIMGEKMTTPEKAISAWNTRTATPSASVERVARAIYAIHPQLGFRDRPGSPPANYAVDWEHAAEVLKEEARDQARAAIAALTACGEGHLCNMGSA